MSIFNKVRQSASEAAKRAQQTVEVTRLRSQISAREKEMEKLYTGIGTAVFRSYTEGDISQSEQEVKNFCEQLQELAEEVHGIQEKIRNVKLVKTCSCGREVSMDVKFCPDCGERFPEEPKPETTVGEIRVICGNCLTENEIQSRYCINCGIELSKITKEGLERAPEPEPAKQPFGAPGGGANTDSRF